MFKTPLRFIVLSLLMLFSCGREAEERFHVQSEVVEQEYIWLSWVESGFLGGDPFYYTIIDAMKAITPHVKVRLVYSEQSGKNKDQIKGDIIFKLLKNAIDTSRVQLIFSARTFGAIQDPGQSF